jgi:hypothetical protein
MAYCCPKCNKHIRIRFGHDDVMPYGGWCLCDLGDGPPNEGGEVMGKFYQYDARGTPASDQIMTLERLLEEANGRIEDLEWENKGIEEWRDFGVTALLRAKEQRLRADAAETNLAEAVDIMREAHPECWWATGVWNRINRFLEKVKT